MQLQAVTSYCSCKRRAQPKTVWGARARGECGVGVRVRGECSAKNSVRAQHRRGLRLSLREPADKKFSPTSRMSTCSSGSESFSHTAAWRAAWFLSPQPPQNCLPVVRANSNIQIAEIAGQRQLVFDSFARRKPCTRGQCGIGLWSHCSCKRCGQPRNTTARSLSRPENTTGGRLLKTRIVFLGVILIGAAQPQAHYPPGADTLT